MNHTLLLKYPATVFAVMLTAVLLAVPVRMDAQRGGQPAAPTTGKAGAAIDLTGYWVSVITEDWKFRMVTPRKGDYNGVRLTPEGLRVADAWDPAKDEAAGNQCRAYGAAGLMRMPGRLRITWQDDNTLRMDTEAGTQTRLFHFGTKAPQAAEPTWQGYSLAEWEYARTARGQPRNGNLKVATTRMKPGYLRKNGVPYSGDATLTEYYRRITASNGDQWLVVLTVVDDPLYLNDRAIPHPSRFITSTQFKKIPDNSSWNPEACSSR